MTPFRPTPDLVFARPCANRSRGGFSLIEVVMAIGVVAFALVAIIGLLPAGMSVYRNAAANSAATQIFEKVLADARQTDFSVLIYQGAGQPNSAATSGRAFREPKLRYFDEAGEEVVPRSGGALSAEEQAKVIYHVNTRIVTNTKVPADKAGHVGQYLATLTVQIANNPSNRALAFDGEHLFVPGPGLQIKTLSSQIAKND